jgi:hypothetical protein
MTPNTGSRQALSNNKVAAALVHDPAVKRAVGALSTQSPSEKDSAIKHSGYGLPCAKCRLYYPAALDTCPNCHHRERVSAVVPKIRPKMTQAVPDPVPDGATVEKEREEFLRQFKSHLREAHAEAAITSGPACSLSQHHPGDEKEATVCHACFERIQERLDLCEAALLVDPKEASQIIYDAVWADPSDPSKTYENAANALLAEIRKRAGITSLMGPFQPLSD